MKLLNYFKLEKKWFQNANILDKNGKEVSLTVKYPNDELDFLQVAEKMSLYGAISVFYPAYSQSRDNVVHKLKSAIYKHTGKIMTIAAFNNDPKTTFADVKRVLELSVATD